VELAGFSETCERTGCIFHSYVLLPNHYHWLLETPEPNLSVGMRWFQGAYAQRFSRRHRLVGHVFQGRYKSPLIDDGTEDYFRTVSEYIHFNPARAGLLDPTKPRLADDRWSSFEGSGEPLEHNGYKVPIAQALIRRTLLKLNG
jgi:putative transposase